MIQSIDLSWIVVQDLKQALKFYTETLGLKLVEYHEEYGWAELQGHNGGSFLGIAQVNAQFPDKPGQNACVTLTVADLEQSISSLKKKGAKCINGIEEVPGHVKMQRIQDADGNLFQLVQKLF